MSISLPVLFSHAPAVLASPRSRAGRGSCTLTTAPVPAGHDRTTLREPLVMTTDGTILDGHVRWQVAKDRQLSSVPCLEYDLTEAEALEVVIDRHGSSQGLNAFCRIRLALSHPSLR